MPILADPRCYAAAHSNPLIQLATQSVEAADATQRNRLAQRLEEAVRSELASAGAESLRAALAGIPSAAVGRSLWSAVDRALGSPDPQSELAATVFAIPIVFVAGRAGAPAAPGEISELSPALADPSRLTTVLKDAGALGGARNFGLDSSMCASDALLQTPLAELFSRLRALENGQDAPGWSLPAAPITLEAQGEQVDLRFLTGLAITGAQAPSLPSTAGDIGRWGISFARELILQLGQPSLSLLPIPRPPRGWLGAHHAGSRAREDIALQAFLSRRLRELRSTEMDPRVELFAPAEEDAIGVKLQSRLDASRAVTHPFRLHPLDDLDEVVASIVDLLRECRLEDVRIETRAEGPDF